MRCRRNTSRFSHHSELSQKISLIVHLIVVIRSNGLTCNDRNSSTVIKNIALPKEKRPVVKSFLCVAQKRKPLISNNLTKNSSCSCISLERKKTRNYVTRRNPFAISRIWTNLKNVEYSMREFVAISTL